MTTIYYKTINENQYRWFRTTLGDLFPRHSPDELPLNKLVWALYDQDDYVGHFDTKDEARQAAHDREHWGKCTSCGVTKVVDHISAKGPICEDCVSLWAERGFKGCNCCEARGELV